VAAQARGDRKAGRIAVREPHATTQERQKIRKGMDLSSTNRDEMLDLRKSF
jgi:hypothetical protein